MPQPSKGAAVFLTLFGLPFLGAGLAFIYAELVSRENFSTTGTVAAVLFGLVFASIGGGLIYAAIGGFNRLKKQTPGEVATPLSPLVWRTHSASPPAATQNKKTANLYQILVHFLHLNTPPTPSPT